MSKSKKTLYCRNCGKLLVKYQTKYCSKSCQLAYQNKTNNPMWNEDARKKNSEAQSGENHWNYGGTASEETRKKLSEAKSGENHPMYGKSHTDESKYKISKSLEGNTNAVGHTHTEETKKSISDSVRLSYENYTYDPNKIQDDYRRVAIDTYGYQCALCEDSDISTRMHVHHLDGNHNNDEVENLCVLCQSCHSRIHPRKSQGDSTPDPKLTQQILESRKVSDTHDHTAQ